VFKGANIGSLTLGNGTVMATDISDAEMSQDQFADAIRN
jgi:hypothetical protein